MAGVITAGAYTLASLGKNAVIPPRIVPFLAMLLGLLVLAHLAVRCLAAGADGTMLPLAALLHGLGYVMITRLDERPGRPADDVEHRRRSACSSPRCWSSSGRPTSPATSGRFLARRRRRCCCCRCVPGLGLSVGGARIWVSLGPINFQPGEFAKLALALFFAGYLAEHRELIADEHVAGRAAAPARAAPPAADRCWRGASPSS